MRCGEKCFFVQTEVDGEKQTKPINARTPAEARKFFRKEYGKESIILSVKRK
ncbi:MAG TPA: hypothetical protein VK072_09310 [Candidatus Avamphibacillus sp.]|nr:hypothetical protein [Candidatus Avamphibacillus sp.]